MRNFVKVLLLGTVLMGSSGVWAQETRDMMLVYTMTTRNGKQDGGIYGPRLLMDQSGQYYPTNVAIMASDVPAGTPYVVSGGNYYYKADNAPQGRLTVDEGASYRMGSYFVTGNSSQNIATRKFASDVTALRTDMQAAISNGTRFTPAQTARSITDIHRGATDIKLDATAGRYTAMVDGRQVTGDYNSVTGQVDIGSYTGRYAASSRQAATSVTPTSVPTRSSSSPSNPSPASSITLPSSDTPIGDRDLGDGISVTFNTPNGSGVPKTVEVTLPGESSPHSYSTEGGFDSWDKVEQVLRQAGVEVVRPSTSGAGAKPSTTSTATSTGTTAPKLNQDDLKIAMDPTRPMSERYAAAHRLNNESGFDALPDEVQRVYMAESNDTLQENMRRALDPNLSMEERQMAAAQVNQEMGYYNMPSDVKKVYDSKAEPAPTTPTSQPKTEAEIEAELTAWGNSLGERAKLAESRTGPGGGGVISGDRGNALGLSALWNPTTGADGNNVFNLSGADNDRLGQIYGVHINPDGTITALPSNSAADQKVADAVIKLDQTFKQAGLNNAAIAATKDYVSSLNKELETLRGQLDKASGAERAKIKEDIKAREKELKEANSKLQEQRTEGLKTAAARVQDAAALRQAVADRTLEHLANAGIPKDGAVAGALLAGKNGDGVRSAIADAARKFAPDLTVDTSSNQSMMRDLKFGAGVADNLLKHGFEDAGLPVSLKPDGSFDYDAMRTAAEGNEGLLGAIDRSEGLHNVLNNEATPYVDNAEQFDNDGAAMSASNAALEDANKDLAAQEGDAVPQIPQTLKVWDVVQTALEILGNEKGDNKVNENKEIIVEAGDIGEEVGAEEATELADIDAAQLGKTAAGAALLTQQLLQAAQIDLNLLDTKVKKTETETSSEEDPLFATFAAGTTTSGVGISNPDDSPEGEDDTSDEDDDDGDELTPEQAGYIKEIQSRRQKLLAQYANAGILISEGMNAISNVFMDRAKALVEFANAQNPPTETGSFGLVQDAGRYVLLETLRAAALSAVQMGVQSASLLNAQDVEPPSPESTDGDSGSGDGSGGDGSDGEGDGE